MRDRDVGARGRDGREGGEAVAQEHRGLEMPGEGVGLDAGVVEESLLGEDPEVAVPRGVILVVAPEAVVHDECRLGAAATQVDPALVLLDEVVRDHVARKGRARVDARIAARGELHGESIKFGSLGLEPHAPVDDRVLRRVGSAVAVQARRTVG